MAARTDEGFEALKKMAQILQELTDKGEEVQVVGTTLVARSGRIGWSASQKKWVTVPYPKRPKKLKRTTTSTKEPHDVPEG